MKRGEYLTLEEIDTLRGCWRDGMPTCLAAERIGCAARTVQHWFRLFRQDAQQIQKVA